MKILEIQNHLQFHQKLKLNKKCLNFSFGISCRVWVQVQLALKERVWIQLTSNTEN